MLEVESFGSVIQRYFAESGMLVFFLIALLFFYWKETGTERKFTICIVAVALVCVFNPLAFWVIRKLGESESYYRFIWMCPILILIAYLLIQIFSGLKSGIQKSALVLMCICCGGMIGGVDTLIKWEIPTNIYQMDDDVVQIADLMDEFSGGERVVFMDNGTLSENMREYNANICETSVSDHYLNQVLYTDLSCFFGLYVRNYVVYNEVDYIAIEKERSGTISVLDGAGLKRVAASEGYYLYQTEWEKIIEDSSMLESYCGEMVTVMNPEYIWIENLGQEYDFLYLTGSFTYYDEVRMQDLVDVANGMDVDAVIINDDFIGNGWTKEQIDAALSGLNMPYLYNIGDVKHLDFEEVTICIGTDTNDAYQARKQANADNSVIMAVPEFAYLPELESDTALVEILSKADTEVSRAVYADGATVEYKMPAAIQEYATLIRVRNKTEIKNYEDK